MKLENKMLSKFIFEDDKKFDEITPLEKKTEKLSTHHGYKKKI